VPRCCRGVDQSRQRFDCDRAIPRSPLTPLGANSNLAAMAALRVRRHPRSIGLHNARPNAERERERSTSCCSRATIAALTACVGAQFRRSVVVLPVRARTNCCGDRHLPVSCQSLSRAIDDRPAASASFRVGEYSGGSRSTSPVVVGHRRVVLFLFSRWSGVCEFTWM